MTAAGGPAAPGGEQFEGARFIDYRGSRYVLGRTDTDYAIWEAAGGSAVRIFELTDEGWTGAWQTYRELEGPGAEPTAVSGWEGQARISLQPMRLGQILDAAFRLYRMNFRVIVTIVALVIVPLQALSLVLQLTTIEPVVISPAPGGPPVQIYQAPGWVSVVTSILYFGVVTPFLTAAVVRAAADAYLEEEVSVGSAYRAALPKIHSILWVTILIVLTILLVSLPAILFGVAAAATGTGAFQGLAVLFALAAVIPAIFLVIRFLFAPAAVVVEDRRGSKALRRSWELARGLGWKVFGTMLLTALIVFVFALVFQLIFFAIFFATGARVTAAFYVWVTVISAVISVLTTPFTNLVIVLLYFDARIRKEGFDLEVMARELERHPSSGA